MLACMAATTLLILGLGLAQSLTIVSGSVVSFPDPVQPSLRIKRQNILYATREAAISFHCHVGGDITTTHTWRVTYTRTNGRLEVDGLRHMVGRTAITIVGNAFASNWHHKFCRTYENHCCCYVMRGTAVGAVEATSLTSTLADTYGRANGVRVGEFCIEVSEDEMCPAKSVVLTATISQCLVHSVVVRLP